MGDVETLWYRSPEIFFAFPSNKLSLDIWSAGCIIAELIRNRALFAGNSQYKQLLLIFQVLGTPDEKRWPQLRDTMVWKKQFPNFKPIKLEYLLTKKEEIKPNVPIFIIELLKKMLKYNPNTRIT